MMYVCLGCYTQQESIKVEVAVPTYDAPGGSVDSIDFETAEYSPLIDGLCNGCQDMLQQRAADLECLESHEEYTDDNLPF